MCNVLTGSTVTYNFKPQIHAHRMLQKFHSLHTFKCWVFYFTYVFVPIYYFIRCIFIHFFLSSLFLQSKVIQSQNINRIHWKGFFLRENGYEKKMFFFSFLEVLRCEDIIVTIHKVKIKNGAQKRSSNTIHTLQW